MNIGQVGAGSGQLKAEKPLVMREGQIFAGKIAKMLPHGFAEIEVGTSKLIAKLEVPLQQGERYWFHVHSLANGLEVKVISPPASAKSSLSKLAETLLQQLSIPVTKENKALAEQMIRDQIPLTKEKIIQAGKWLEDTGVSRGMSIIKTMLDRSFPFTKDVFQSLASAQSPASFHQLSKELVTALKQLADPPASAQRLMKLLDETQMPLSKSIAHRILSAVVDALVLPGKPAAEQAAALQLLKSWGVIPANAQSLDMALSGLLHKPELTVRQETPVTSNERMLTAKKAAIEATVAELRAAVRQLVKEPTNKEALQSLLQALQQLSGRPSGSGEQMPEIPRLVASVREHGFKSEQAAAVFKLAAKLIVENDNLSVSLRQLDALFQQEEGMLLREVRRQAQTAGIQSPATPLKAEAWFQQLVVSAEQQAHQQLAGKDALALIKEAFQRLGVDLESLLGAKGRENADFEQMIKPQLLRLMAEGVPASIKDAAEQMLGRINAQQLLSGDNGPMQQLVMQVPVHLFGWQTDLTLQWSGKKTERDQLDPSYCRVLFYLTLENIRETVIDMQVQNRIISLQIFNETDGLKAAAEPFIPALKAGMEKRGYQLSNVQFKKPKQAHVAPMAEVMHEQPYAGVDIRV
ncbi:hypothetical protein [Bacillus xiapuensis]|uniref:hypothetical protein n=1 Tax=Bacillus xiapuensis TaxID=2014075 RepID=UPI000C245AD4|nr:hypothetical protein [Bacillus xiapuensis]